MANSFSLYMMQSFPEVSEPIEVMYQGVLLQAEVDHPPTTQVTLKRKIPEIAGEVYRIRYEHIEHQSGRVAGNSFTQFIAMDSFPGFYIRQEQLFIVKAPKNLARGAMRMLTTSAPNVRGDFRRIDLDSIGDFIESFKAAYFRVVDGIGVSSIGLHGTSVEQDFRFARASSEEGGMKYIRFDHRFAGETFHVGLSEESNVVVYNQNLDELLEIQLVLDIKLKLIDRAASSI